jgi:hypothetical protein
VKFQTRDRSSVYQRIFFICFIINGKSIKVRYTLYQVLYEVRYIEIFLNNMKLVFKKKFGKSRVRYIVGSLYRGQTVGRSIYNDYYKSYLRFHILVEIVLGVLHKF